MVLETSFPPFKKCTMSKSRAAHSDWTPIGCHSLSYILPAAYKMELLNPKVGHRVHISSETLLSLKGVTKHNCLCGQYYWPHCWWILYLGRISSICVLMILMSHILLDLYKELSFTNVTWTWHNGTYIVLDLYLPWICELFSVCNKRRFIKLTGHYSHLSFGISVTG